MVKRIRVGGPQGVVRPYLISPQTDEPIEQIAQALDHIAVSLSAMDDNLERVARLLHEIAQKQGALPR